MTPEQVELLPCGCSGAITTWRSGTARYSRCLTCRKYWEPASNSTDGRRLAVFETVHVGHPLAWPDTRASVSTDAGQGEVERLGLVLLNDDRVRNGWPTVDTLAHLADADANAYRGSARAVLTALRASASGSGAGENQHA